MKTNPPHSPGVLPHVGAAPFSEEELSAAGSSRRSLITYAVSAPVVTMAAGLAVPAEAQAAVPLTPPDTTDYYDLGDAITQSSAPTMPLVRLSVAASGRIVFDMPRLESGQGLSTALGMIIAEELDVPASMVDVTESDARPELLFNMLTGGSSSIRSFANILPLLAAQLRARLLLAAAKQMNVPSSSLSTANGSVLSATGASITYGALTFAASLIPPPLNVLPKSPGSYKVVGKSTRRIDAMAIVTGRKQFTMDLQVPGAKPTMVCRPPTIMGTVVRVNNLAAVQAMPGVIGVCVLPTGGIITPIPPGVAVMADTFSQAWDAVNALNVTWGPGTIDGQSNATITAQLKAAVPPAVVPALSGLLGGVTLDAEFTMAPLPHAPMETDCAIADVRKDANGNVISCELWAGMQSPIVASRSVALDLGLPTTAVTAHVISSGGSFGRRLFWDPVQQAAQISKILGRPCKLMYHRAHDMRHGRGRPLQYHRVRARTLLGQVISFDHRIASPRLDTRHGFGDMLTAVAASAPSSVQQSLGNMAVEEALFLTMVTKPYNYGLASRLLLPQPVIMNTGSYRSVHIQPTRTVEEIMTDEIANSLGQDPVAFRMSVLRDPRAKAVLQTVATSGQWGRTMPANCAQGIAVHAETRSFAACLIEIDATASINGTGPALVTKAVMAIDVGNPINPIGVEAQMMSALNESITIVLMGGLHVQNGLPQEGSYSQYHFSRIRHFPKDCTVLIMPPTGQPIGGLGEVGLTTTSAAIANAWARATGIKARNFPLYFPLDFTPFPPDKLPTRLNLPLPTSGQDHDNSEFQSGWRASSGGRAGRHLAAVGAARQAGIYRSQVRLWHQCLQGLYVSGRRQGVHAVCHPRVDCQWP